MAFLKQIDESRIRLSAGGRFTFGMHLIPPVSISLQIFIPSTKFLNILIWSLQGRLWPVVLLTNQQNWVSLPKNLQGIWMKPHANRNENSKNGHAFFTQKFNNIITNMEQVVVLYQLTLYQHDWLQSTLLSSDSLHSRGVADVKEDYMLLPIHS